MVNCWHSEQHKSHSPRGEFCADLEANLCHDESGATPDPACWHHITSIRPEFPTRIGYFSTRPCDLWEWRSRPRAKARITKVSNPQALPQHISVPKETRWVNGGLQTYSLFPYLIEGDHGRPLINSALTQVAVLGHDERSRDLGHIIAMWRSKPQKMFGESSELGSPESVSRCAQQQPANHATDPYLAPLLPLPKAQASNWAASKTRKWKGLTVCYSILTQYSWLQTRKNL